jgi:hypothetical protein
MYLTKPKSAVAIFLAVAVLGPGAGWVAQEALAQKPTQVVDGAGERGSSEMTGTVTAVDRERRTVTLRTGKHAPEPQTFDLTADIQVLLDDGSGDKLGFRDGKLSDLAAGDAVTLRLGEDRKVSRIWVEGPIIQGSLKAVDPATGSITVAVSKTKGEPPSDQVFAVGTKARFEIENGRPNDKSRPSPPATLADLPVNAVVFVRLSADRKVVGSVRAEGQTITGRLKTVNGDKHTLTVTISTKGEPDEEKTFRVVDTASVPIDDGKLRDKTRQAETPRLADLPVGSRVVLRLVADGQSVVAVRAEGETVYGTVKAADAAKNTVTVHDKQNPDGKTYTVRPDAVVFLDDKAEPKTLADLQAGAVVPLRLLADQKTVQEVRATGPTAMGTVAETAGNDSVILREKGGDKTYAVARDARIVIDGTRDGKVAEVIEGTVARLRLSVDQSKVLEVQAEGPSYTGKVKAFDPDRGTITLTVGFKMDVEDKEFKLTKDTAVVTEVYGVPVPRTDLRADREVVLRLTIDQKSAGRITVLGQ